jgi:hypothetical protein
MKLVLHASFISLPFIHPGKRRVHNPVNPVKKPFCLCTGKKPHPWGGALNSAPMGGKGKSAVIGCLLISSGTAAWSILGAWLCKFRGGADTCIRARSARGHSLLYSYPSDRDNKSSGPPTASFPTPVNFPPNAHAREPPLHLGQYLNQLSAHTRPACARIVSLDAKDLTPIFRSPRAPGS